VIAALRYEWVRISTVRSTRICVVLAVLFGAGLGYLASNPTYNNFDDTGMPVGDPTVDWYGAFGFPLLLAVVLASIVAAQAIGQEYRFGLSRLTLTAFPQRGRILAAKLALVVLACVVIALLSYLGSWIGVAVHGYPSPPSNVVAPDSTYLLRGVAYVVLWGLSAFALAGITRQTAIGIAVPLISGLIVENILQALLVDRARWLTDILPWSTATRWMSSPTEMSPDPDFVVDSPTVAWAALGIFAVWVTVFLVVQVVSFLKRDA
jgi:ABC-type transport system involved in multi-copper enzyme maturation permease subunit